MGGLFVSDAFDRSPQWQIPADQPDSTTIPPQGHLPEHFSLAQNHPNPFNPATTISYALAEAADVRLTVYAANGQRVTTLVSAFQPAGHYQVTWGAQGQASGVYFYSVQAGSFVETKRMLLLK